MLHHSARLAGDEINHGSQQIPTGLRSPAMVKRGFRQVWPAAEMARAVYPRALARVRPSAWITPRRARSIIPVAMSPASRSPFPGEVAG